MGCHSYFSFTSKLTGKIRINYPKIEEIFLQNIKIDKTVDKMIDK